MKTDARETRLMLTLLDAIERDSTVTQRSLARQLGVALGLTNSYFKRCIKRGLIKTHQAPSNRYAYYLTPGGFAEKARLTGDFLNQSFQVYRIAREESDALFRRCVREGWRSIVLLGKTEITEILVISVADFDLEFAAIVDAEARKTTDTFMKIPVVASSAAAPPADVAIVADLNDPIGRVAEASATFPKDRILVMPLLTAISARRDAALEEAETA